MKEKDFINLLLKVCKEFNPKLNYIDEGKDCDSLVCVKHKGKLVFRESYEKVMFVYNNCWLRVACKSLRNLKLHEIQKKFNNVSTRILCFGYARGYKSKNWEGKRCYLMLNGVFEIKN